MEVVKELFETEDLYAILGISKGKVGDERALRSAYMKAAIKNHPDKAAEEDRETFTKKFQIIQKIYELFKDADLRKIYDDTGAWPEDDKIDFDVASFGRLDESAILEFKKMYQGSEEERQDIKKYYQEGQGDIFNICDKLFFANVLDDEERINKIIDSLIEKGEMKRLTKGVKEEKDRKKKLSKAEKEAKEAEEMRKEMKVESGMEGLMKAIARNNSVRRQNFLDELAATYAADDDKDKKKNAPKGGKKKEAAKAKADGGPSSKKAKSSEADSNGSSNANGGGRVTRSRTGSK